MDIEEIRTKRIELELQLGALVKGFEDETGVQVEEQLKYEPFYSEHGWDDTKPCVTTSINIGYSSPDDSKELEVPNTNAATA